MQQTITAKLQIIVNPLDKQILHDTMKAYSNAVIMFLITFIKLII